MDEQNFSYEGMRILVVDDLPPNRLLIQKYFSKLGCEGDFAENGQDALDKIRENKYDLVLMDIQMPVMDGVQAVKIIRSEIDELLPVVALSGSATEEQLQETLNVGMTDYCMKPVSYDKIRAVVEKYSPK